MNRHWAVKLENVAEINPRAPKHIADDDDVAFVPMSAVSEDGSLGEHRTRTYAEVKKGYTYFERGDVLVARITPCFENGKAALVDNLVEPIGFGSTEFHVLRPGPELHGKYLFYMLWNEKFRTVATGGMTGSAGQKRVPAELLRRTEIRLPPLDEQRRIAAILDNADALRQKRKRAIALLDSLTQSIFLEMFGSQDEGWPTATIGEVGSNIRTGPFGSQLLHSEFVDQGIAVLGIDNVVQNTFGWAKPRFITEKKYSSLKRYKVHPGDVLITIMGTIGRCAVVPDDVVDAINTKHLCCITPDTGRVLSDYLRATFLGHPDVLRQLGAQSKGAIMDGLNMGTIKGLQIPIPPLALQQRFSGAIAAISATLNSATELQRAAEALFSSLQHRAFSGQL